jgi:hypothetical protein
LCGVLRRAREASVTIAAKRRLRCLRRPTLDPPASASSCPRKRNGNRLAALMHRRLSRASVIGCDRLARRSNGSTVSTIPRRSRSNRSAELVAPPPAKLTEGRVTQQPADVPRGSGSRRGLSAPQRPSPARAADQQISNRIGPVAVRVAKEGPWIAGPR